jgi:hypothetical protein
MNTVAPPAQTHRFRLSRIDHTHIALSVGIVLTLISAAVTVWDWRTGGAHPDVVDRTLAGVLGGLTLAYAFLSLRG